MDIRETIYTKALESWKKVGGKGTWEIATGVGKTRLSLKLTEFVRSQLLKHGQESFKCLIIVPSEIIRDMVYPSEFSKWNLADLKEFCTIECIQTVYKWENTEWDLVICDEMHRFIPNADSTQAQEYEFAKFFERNKYRFLLGLSATIDLELRQYLNKLAPIVFKYTLEQAFKDGLVSPFTIINIPVELTLDESKAYKKNQLNYNYYERELGGPYDCFKNASKYLAITKDNYTQFSNNWEEAKDLKKFALGLYACIKKRKHIVSNASNKVIVAQSLMKSQAFDKSKGILFSDTIELAEALTASNNETISFHSKLSKPQRSSAIEDFNQGVYKWLSTVNAVNEGLSITAVDIAISLAGNSKSRVTIQRLGRICRKMEGKSAFYIRLYIPQTQDEKWMIKSQSDFNIKFIKNVKNVDEALEIIEETKSLVNY